MKHNQESEFIFLMVTALAILGLGVWITIMGYKEIEVNECQQSIDTKKKLKIIGIVLIVIGLMLGTYQLFQNKDYIMGKSDSVSTGKSMMPVTHSKSSSKSMMPVTHSFAHSKSSGKSTMPVAHSFAHSKSSGKSTMPVAHSFSHSRAMSRPSKSTSTPSKSTSTPTFGFKFY